MTNTKNDLSFNKVKLDYLAMLRTAEVAYGRCIENISGYIGKLREYGREREHKSPELTAGWLLDEAKRLVVVAETLEALQGGLEREVVEVVNKPPVEQTSG